MKLWHRKVTVGTLVAQGSIECEVRNLTKPGSPFIPDTMRASKIASGTLLHHPALDDTGLLIPSHQLELTLIDFCLEIRSEAPPVIGWKIREIKLSRKRSA